MPSNRSFRSVCGALLTAGLLVAAVVMLTAPADAGPPRCFGKAATIVRGSGNDQIRGTSGADVIVSRGGTDTVLGKGGSDRTRPATTPAETC